MPAQAKEEGGARRRGRPPREELVAFRRQQIVEAAYEVFAEKGYTAAGIADIAEKLGIGHGTFYRYFENKRDILDHVVDYGVERFAAEIRSEAPPEDAETFEEFTDQLRRIAERVFALVDSEPGLVQIIALEATSIDEEMTQRLLGLIETGGVLAAQYLEHGVERGFLRAGLDTEVVAHGLSALIIPGLIKALRGSFGPGERRRYENGLINLICDGIRA